MNVIQDVMMKPCVEGAIARGTVCQGCNWYKDCGILDHFPNAFDDDWESPFNDVCWDCRRTINTDDPIHVDHRKMSVEGVVFP